LNSQMNSNSVAEDRGIARAGLEHQDALKNGPGHVVPFTTLENDILPLAPDDTDPPAVGNSFSWNPWFEPPGAGFVVDLADMTPEFSELWAYIRQSRKLRARRQQKGVGEFTIGPARP
jgi:hypothetical protein